jgi:hypothetical protein
LHPNSCHRASVLHHAACFLRLLSIYLQPTCSADAGTQDMPSVTAQCFCSTWNQRGNCGPILTTVPLYRIRQFVIFVFCPFTLTSRRQGDAGIQGTLPSARTLFFRSTRNQRGKCDPILVTVRLYCTASFSLLSSSAVHLPARLVAPPMLRSRTLCRRFKHCISFDPETLVGGGRRNSTGSLQYPKADFCKVQVARSDATEAV